MTRLSDREGKIWADRLTDPPAAPVSYATPDVPPALPAVTAVDDAIAVYVAALREPFGLLRQAEAQLAGLLVLAAASGQAIAGHPMLGLAADAFDEAADGIRAVRVPGRGRHHHAHVVEAARLIDLAMSAARRCLARRDEKAVAAALAPLRAAHQHLLWATAALPGFEVVSLSEACCAQHAGQQQRAP